jgi:hypothetical protein|tara:strand:+ start:825 stop:998 length:174 start_codon:yes stop_codon:yes gene_type:complete
MNKTTMDIGIGAGAIATPAWLTTATGVGELIIVGLGIALVAVRLMISLREWKSTSKD